MILFCTACDEPHEDCDCAGWAVIISTGGVEVCVGIMLRYEDDKVYIDLDGKEMCYQLDQFTVSLEGDF